MILIFLIVYLSGQDIVRFQSSFRREVKKYGKSDSTAGEVFYTAQKVILKVSGPIRQWIEVRHNETKLYYPHQQKGIILKSKQESFVNFINTFLASVHEDYNLSSQGFSLYDNVFKGDTLYSYWRTDKTSIKFTLIHYKNRLVKVESTDEENNFFTSVSFSEYILFAGRHYPLKMMFIHIYKDDRSEELVVLSKISFNQSFPDEIVKFKMPEDVELKVIEW